MNTLILNGGKTLYPGQIFFLNKINSTREQRFYCSNQSKEKSVKTLKKVQNEMEKIVEKNCIRCDLAQQESLSASKFCFFYATYNVLFQDIFLFPITSQLTSNVAILLFVGLANPLVVYYYGCAISELYNYLKDNPECISHRRQKE